MQQKQLGEIEVKEELTSTKKKKINSKIKKAELELLEKNKAI